jgi:NADH-quinone oxidoreductase subunit A
MFRRILSENLGHVPVPVYPAACAFSTCAFSNNRLCSIIRIRSVPASAACRSTAPRQWGKPVPGSYLGLLVLAGLAFLFAVAVLIVSTLLGPRRRGTSLPYESGVSAPLSAPGRQRLPVRYYRVALLFLVFDVEAVFVYPWAVTYRRLGTYALGEMFVFLGILFFGYWYARKRGGLEWE